MGSSGTQPHDWREWRRMRALDLAQLGWKQRDIAVALDASEGAVSRWLAAARRGGPEALRSNPGPGPTATLTSELDFCPFAPLRGGGQGRKQGVPERSGEFGKGVAEPLVCKNPIHPQPTSYRRDRVGERRLDLARPIHPGRRPRGPGQQF